MKKGIKVFIINSVPYGSTGRIMFQLAQKVEDEGGCAVTAASFTKKRKINLPEKHYQIGSAVGKYFHIQMARRTGKHGFYSKIATRRLIRKMKEFSPDVIHLHNLHEGFLNLPYFFEFIKKYNKPVVWTLHDCWAFTGHCPHFTFAQCYKWKTECNNCPNYNKYPSCNIDDSAFQYIMKKELFQNVTNLTIVTPSAWLKNMVQESFLRDYPIRVINNGIDLEVFHPLESNFRAKLGLQAKFVILGVAFDWGERKGLHVFQQLAKELDDEFAIVMVGVSPEVRDKLPENVITIECTQNQRELAEIYSAADVFVNPTLEDNFPTVNMEALACGTPIITYQTGGSPEVVTDECGVVVAYNDYVALKKEIIDMKEKNGFSSELVSKRAGTFSLDNFVDRYFELYREL